MSWNGSNGKAETKDGSVKKKLSASSVGGSKGMKHGIIAGLIVVALGGAAVWLMTGNGNENDEAAANDKKPKKIAEATPHIVTNEPAEVVEKPKKKRYVEMTDDEKLQHIRDKYGDNIPESLKSTVYFLEHPVKQSFKETPPSYKIFKHMSENDIASLLVVEPGDFFLRKPFYDENFDRDFKKSLEEKIEFSDDDTEEQRELKQAVMETKKDFAERMKAGESPSDIMNAAVDQMYELGVYKEQLQGLLNEYHADETFSDKDIEDFITAANEMLQKRGASPLQMPNFTMRQAKLRAIARKKAVLEQEENQNQ